MVLNVFKYLFKSRIFVVSVRPLPTIDPNVLTLLKFMGGGYPKKQFLQRLEGDSTLFSNLETREYSFQLKRW